MATRRTRVQVRKALAATIKALRKRNGGMSQEHLALACGVDRSYLSEIERGLRSATIETVCRLMVALKVNCAQFGREFDKHWDE